MSITENNVNVVYLLNSFQEDLDDLIIYVTEKDAINISIQYPHLRVEIFQKKESSNIGGLTMSYNYFQNGTYYNKENPEHWLNKKRNRERLRSGDGSDSDTQYY